MTHGKLYAVVLKKICCNKTMVPHFFCHCFINNLVYILYNFIYFLVIFSGGGETKISVFMKFLVFKKFCCHIQIAYSEVRYYWYITIEFGQKYS